MVDTPSSYVSLLLNWFVWTFIHLHTFSRPPPLEPPSESYPHAREVSPRFAPPRGPPPGAPPGLASAGRGPPPGLTPGHDRPPGMSPVVASVQGPPLRNADQPPNYPPPRRPPPGVPPSGPRPPLGAPPRSSGWTSLQGAMPGGPLRGPPSGLPLGFRGVSLAWMSASGAPPVVMPPGIVPQGLPPGMQPTGIAPAVISPRNLPPGMAPIGMVPRELLPGVTLADLPPRTVPPALSRGIVNLESAPSDIASRESLGTSLEMPPRGLPFEMLRREEPAEMSLTPQETWLRGPLSADRGHAPTNEVMSETWGPHEGLLLRGPPRHILPARDPFAAAPLVSEAFASSFKKLTIKVLRVCDVKSRGTMDTSDLYVKLMIGEHTVQTKAQEHDGKTLELNESFDFILDFEKILVVEVWSVDNDGQDKLIGHAKVEIVPWVVMGGFEGEIDIKDRKGSLAGKLAIVANLTKSEEPGAVDPANLKRSSPNVSARRALPRSNRDPHGNFTDEEILEAFEAFDLDHNKYVGAAEIRYVLINIGEDPTDEEVDEMIKMVDKDGDGQVSFDEFYAMVTNGKKPPPGLRVGVTKAVGAGLATTVSSAKVIQMRRHRKTALEEFARNNKMNLERVKRAYKCFKDTDKDGSGLIPYSEFCEILQVDSSPQCEMVFQLFDNDKSDRVDFQEFMITLSNFTGADKEDKLKFAFYVLDEDGNGVVTRQELVKILKANHMASSEAEVTHKVDTIMSHSDKDGDGVISFDEFLIVSKKFPNILFPAFSKRLV